MHYLGTSENSTPISMGCIFAVVVAWNSSVFSLGIKLWQLRERNIVIHHNCLTKNCDFGCIVNNFRHKGHEQDGLGLSTQSTKTKQNETKPEKKPPTFKPKTPMLQSIFFKRKTFLPTLQSYSHCPARCSRSAPSRAGGTKKSRWGAK